MAKKKSQKSDKNKDARTDEEIRAAMNQPWLQMRTGIIIMGLGSLVLALFTAWQLAPSEGWLKAIGWGLFFGAAMWAIFLVGLWFNRFVRRDKKE